MSEGKIAAQLFTIRDHVTNRTGFADSLAKLSDIGYKYVQFAAVGAVDGDDADTSPAEARKILDDNGLKAFSAHRLWGLLKDQTSSEIDYLHALGASYVTVPIIRDVYDPNLTASYSRFIDDAAEVIEKLSDSGIQLGFHNHSWEFMQDASGRNGMDVLIDDASSQLLIELDVYWASVTGADPVELLARASGRTPCLHVKDSQVIADSDQRFPQPVFAPVGEGLLNWNEIITAGKNAGVEYWIVEQDICRRDPFDCLRSSFQFLSARV